MTESDPTSENRTGITTAAQAEVVVGVPEYLKYLTARELDASSEKLAAEFPTRVKRTEVGKTRSGQPIWAIAIGEGARTALLVGAPHANEPVGGLTTDYLSRAWAENEQLGGELGFRLVVVKALDRDGLVLNEGWLKGPFTHLNYALHYYRGPAEEQPEWTFPVDYRGYTFSAPCAETQALMRALEEFRPDFLYSLHNGDVGPLWHYVNREIAGLSPALRESAARFGIPLRQTAAAEEPWSRRLSDGVYDGLSIRRAVDFLLERNEDPGAVLLHGASSLEWAEQMRPATFGLVTEVPTYCDARSSDETPTTTPREEVFRAISRRWSEMSEHVKSVYQLASGSVPLRPGPFRASIEHALRFLETRDVIERSMTQDVSGFAGVNEVFFSEVNSRLYVLRVHGLLFRFIEEQLPIGGLRTDLSSELLTEMRGTDLVVEHELAGKHIPIQNQVRIQVASCLLAMKALSQSS